jgi:hypothetical protein
MIDDGELAALTSQPLVWQDLSEFDEQKDLFFAYQTQAQGHELRLTINDSPAEPFYTLFVDGEAVASFDDFPAHWTKPAE